MLETSSLQARHAPDFQALFEAAPGLFLVLDAGLHIVAASNAYLQATMTRREQVLGRHLFDVFPDNPDDEDANGVRNLRASLERVKTTLRPDTMGVQRYDVRRPAEQGGGFEQKYWSPSNSPVVDPQGRLSYIIHRVEDVTAYVQLQHAGEQQRADAQRMEQEIVLRSQELADSKRRLERANAELAQLYRKGQELDRLKNRFFANISHELRTPLALIQGPLDKLLAAEGLPEDARHDVQTARRNARKLLRHVNDLLDVAQLDAGKLRMSYSLSDIAALTRSLEEHFRSFAREKHIEFTVEAPSVCQVEVDAEKVRRILAHLLANAFKYTPERGRVRCTLALDARGEWLQIEIADSGPGIPPERRAVVFERFGQLDSPQHRAGGGIGLGLTIVGEFVQLHGGDVSIGEAAEGGASLRIRLPAHAPAEALLAAEAADFTADFDDLAMRVPAAVKLDAEQRSRAAAGAPLVLVVEDSEELNMLMCSALAREFRTASALDGREGLQKARELQPDLVLTDLMMPHMSGDELMRELRRDSAFDATPIVILTAKADDEFRLELLREGANDYVTKPVALEEMVVRVRSLVAAKVANDRVRQANEELRTANAELDAFSASASHDLRAPLRAIRGYCGLLLEEHSRELPPPALTFLQRINAASERMRELIEDLLQFSRVGRAPLTLQSVDLSYMAQMLFTELRESEPNRHVRTTIHPQVTAQADANLLRVLLTNLLSNAWKFSSKVAEPHIEIGCDDAGPVRTYFVRDNGAGFDMAYVHKLFQPFERLHTLAEFSGTGIGLATAQRIVHRHGGRIWADSSPGRGSTFYWTLAPTEAEHGTPARPGEYN